MQGKHARIALLNIGRALAVVGGLSFGLPATAVERSEVMVTCADIAQAGYEDSLRTARRLAATVDTLVYQPSAEALQMTKDAWLAARVPFLQTQVFRDITPEAQHWYDRVDAWPMDEGLIDYVDASYQGSFEGNALYDLNIIATDQFELQGEPFQAGVISHALLTDVLHGAEGAPGNVATGYHAIEFLLWGQDLNGHEAGNGARPWTDFDRGEGCTNDNCDRRVDYLRAATDLLISDLEEMVQAWSPEGTARKAFLSEDTAGLSGVLHAMRQLPFEISSADWLALMGTLDEFSDDTHNALFYSALGVRNVYLGSYVRTNASVIGGASLSDLVAAKDTELNRKLTTEMSQTLNALSRVRTAADAGLRVDQMLAPDNAAGRALLGAALEGLGAQSATLAQMARSFDLTRAVVPGPDSLDPPDD